MILDWLIIGGGIHGVHLAARLLDAAKITRDSLRIIDPNKRLLDRWRTCTAVTGMTHLRSPVVHHLGVNAWSLRRYIQGREQSESELEPFAPPYERPSLGLFNAHCDEVIETFELDQLHIRAQATQCTLDDDYVSVQLSTGELVKAKRIVLAIGMGEAPHWPDWARRDQYNGELHKPSRIAHVFAPGFNDWPQDQETVAVVGGGISAAQVALRLAEEGHHVHLISRHDLREHQFDSDPGWLGPKFMQGFSEVRDVNQRRDIITEARHRGSVPPDVKRALRRAVDQGSISWCQGQVESCDQYIDQESDQESCSLILKLSTSESIKVQRVLLATGFSPKLPGGAFVADLARSAELPQARCGYPIVDEGLRWHPRVYVSGPLAELEIGPVSRNIAGAQRSSNRIIEALLAEQPRASLPPLLSLSRDAQDAS